MTQRKVIKDIDIDNTIRNYLQTYPRNKLVVVRRSEKFAELPKMDVGKELSLYIRQNELEDIKQQCYQFLMQCFDNHISNDDDYGKFICLYNVGILFEQELGFDVTDIIARLSKNVLVFLPWSGELKNNSLYFLSSTSKHKISLSKFNYTII